VIWKLWSPPRQPLRSDDLRAIEPGGEAGVIRRVYPYLVLGVSVAMVAVALAFGEFRAVLVNATTICLNCIRIG
jgi:hypothetical protein